MRNILHVFQHAGQGAILADLEKEIENKPRV